MSDELLAGDPADESAAAAEVEVASDDADAAAAEDLLALGVAEAFGDDDNEDAAAVEASHAAAFAALAEARDDEDDVVDFASADDIGAVADLLASALISGSAQQADAAINAYNALGREPVAGGPLKAALPEVEEAPVEGEETS